MAAHYRVIDSEDPTEKRLVAFSIESQAGFLQPNKCCFYEWDVHGKQAARNAFGVPDATFGMFHDCLVTENWYLLLQNPNKLDPQKLIGEYMFAKCAPLAEVIAFQEGQPTLSCTCSRGRTRRGRLARRPSTSITSSSSTT